MIRAVEPKDVDQLVKMYNYYIRETVATFEEVELNAAEFSRRVEEISSKFPYLVYEEDGVLLGYAYANTFRTRVAYRFTVETSVYVRHDVFRGGVGSKLYAHLIDLCKEAGYHRAIGGITLPNASSEKFHEKFGYVKIAHFSEVGRKFDQWRDVGFWELKL